MSDDLIKTLVDSLSGELLKEQPDIKVTEARLKQYQDIFGSTAPLMDEIHETTISKKFDKIFSAYTKSLLTSRPDLQAKLNELEVIPINSRSHSSFAYQLNGRSFVIIDMITMQFIWMMNKAFLCRMFEQGDSAELFAKVYLHFATVIGHKDIDFVFEKPKTPPHKSEQSLHLLSLITTIQEKFLLAHEIAHLVITADEIEQHTDNYSAFTALGIQSKSTPAMEVELAVDKMAFDLVLADLKSIYPQEIVEFGCEMILLLIRYFMWLRVILNLDESDSDPQFYLWLARNKQLRELFRRELDSRDLELRIIEMLDYLESSQELGAMAAQKLLRKYRDENK